MGIAIVLLLGATIGVGLAALRRPSLEALCIFLFVSIPTAALAVAHFA